MSLPMCRPARLLGEQHQPGRLNQEKSLKDEWGKIYYQKLALGWDNGCAAFAADEAIKRREHKTSPDCWCEPEQDHLEPDLWIHRDIH